MPKCPKCRSELKKTKNGYACMTCRIVYKAKAGTEKPASEEKTVKKETKKTTVKKTASPQVKKQETKEKLESVKGRYIANAARLKESATAAVISSVALIVVLFGLSAMITGIKGAKTPVKAAPIKAESAVSQNTHAYSYRERAAYNAVSEVKKPDNESAADDTRIYNTDDIPGRMMDTMVWFTTNDLKGRLADKNDAMKIFGRLLDTKYAVMFPDGDEANKHPYSYWASYEPENGERSSDLSFGTPIAIDTFLVKDKEDGDSGTFYILYEVGVDLMAPFTLQPGNSDTLNDKVYISYSYSVDLSDQELAIMDYNDFRFGGEEGADINPESWRLKNITKNRDAYELMDEASPAKG